MSGSGDNSALVPTPAEDPFGDGRWLSLVS